MLREFVPDSPLQPAASALLEDTAPLLEEERYLCSMALVTNVENPVLVHWTSPGPRFAADDNPIDPFQGKVGERPEERFERQEPDCCWYSPEIIDS